MVSRFLPRHSVDFAIPEEQKATDNERPERFAVKRRNGIRARSVPREGWFAKRGLKSREQPQEPLDALCADEDVSHLKSEQNRRASCPALDWFSGSLEWQTAVASSSTLNTSENMRDPAGSVVDIRHARVKSESPTVVHQQRPFAIEAQSAEIMSFEDFVGAALPPGPEPSEPSAEHLRRHSEDSSTSSSEDDQWHQDLLLEMVSKRHTQRPLLSVGIPEEELSVPAEMYQMIWGKS